MLLWKRCTPILAQGFALRRLFVQYACRCGTGVDSSVSLNTRTCSEDGRVVHPTGYCAGRRRRIGRMPVSAVSSRKPAVGSGTPIGVTLPVPAP